MKRVITAISIIMAMLTSATIICTLLTTYQFIYVGQIFNSYRPIQAMIAATMVIWAIKYMVNRRGWKDIAYSVVFLIFAGISLYFFNYVQ